MQPPKKPHLKNPKGHKRQLPSYAIPLPARGRGMAGLGRRHSIRELLNLHNCEHSEAIHWGNRKDGLPRRLRLLAMTAHGRETPGLSTRSTTTSGPASPTSQPSPKPSTLSCAFILGAARAAAIPLVRACFGISAAAGSSLKSHGKTRSERPKVGRFARFTPPLAGHIRVSRADLLRPCRRVNSFGARALKRLASLASHCYGSRMFEMRFAITKVTNT